MKPLLTIFLTFTLVFSPFVSLAQETTPQPEPTTLVEYFCYETVCVGEITAQITDDIVGVLPFFYDLETDTTVINIAPDLNLFSSLDPSTYTLEPILDGTTPTKRIYLADKQVASIKNTGGSAVPTYLTLDHLGSTAYGLSKSGGITQTLDYYPFGDIRVNTGSTDEKKKFTGYIYDTDTDLNYAGARYYRAKVGRFLSEDTQFLSIGTDNDALKNILIDPQGLNSYSYSRNNPLRYVDPTGESFRDFYQNSFNNFANSRAEFTSEQIQNTGALNLPYYYRQSGDPQNTVRANTEKIQTMAQAAMGVAFLVEGGGLGKGNSSISITNLSNAAQEFLSKGSPTNVYIGSKAGADSYIGISNNLERRISEHGSRFGEVTNIGSLPTKNQARAVEQAGINMNPHFENKINSISPNNTVFNEVVSWGRSILKSFSSEK